MPRHDWIEVSRVRKRDPRAAIETRARVAAYSATAFNTAAWIGCGLAIALGAYVGTRLADTETIDRWVNGISMPRLSDITPAAGPKAPARQDAVFVVDTDGQYYGELLLGTEALTVGIDPLAANSRLSIKDLEAAGVSLSDGTAVVVLSGISLAGQPIGAIAVNVDRQPNARSVLGQDIVAQLDGWRLSPISARQQAMLHSRQN